jgi:hypothetical protein
VISSRYIVDPNLKQSKSRIWRCGDLHKVANIIDFVEDSLTNSGSFNPAQLGQMMKAHFSAPIASSKLDQHHISKRPIIHAMLIPWLLRTPRPSEHPSRCPLVNDGLLLLSPVVTRLSLIIGADTTRKKRGRIDKPGQERHLPLRGQQWQMFHAIAVPNRHPHARYRRRADHAPNPLSLYKREGRPRCSNQAHKTAHASYPPALNLPSEVEPHRRQIYVVTGPNASPPNTKRHTIPPGHSYRLGPKRGSFLKLTHFSLFSFVINLTRRGKYS